MRSSSYTLAALALATAGFIATPAALAAAATATATFDGIAEIRTTGTASVLFTGFEFLEASGTIAGGTADVANDAMSFDVEISPFGAGEAFNGGVSGASSFATTSGTPLAQAFTFVDAEMLIDGSGTVEIDIVYSLFVDQFGNLASAFANAGLFASTSFAFEEIDIEVLGSAAGSDAALSGILTLSFLVDVDPLLGPFEDILTVHTFANASAAPVPLPAALWLLAPALAGLAGVRRKAA